MAASEAEALYNKANSLFVDDDFEDALRLYNDAVQLVGPADAPAAYFLKRSNCHFQLKNYRESIADANQALAKDPKNATALLRKGIGCFSLEEYEAAKAAFEALLAVKDTAATRTWIRKCEAELDDEDDEEDDGAEQCLAPMDDSGPGEIAAPAAAPFAVPVNEPVAAPAAAAPAPVAVAETADKPRIRHDWYQTGTHVYVEVFAKKVQKESATIDVQERSLGLSIKLGEHQYYENNLDLFSAVRPEATFVEYLSTKVVVRLEKADGVHWAALEAVPVDPDVRSIAVEASSSAPAAFSTKRWDEILKDEEEEKLEGDAALQKVFQDIYGRGSDEQRKAMIKSFTESGGTVLSTNWDDVGKKKVECTPPAGLQAKTWKDAEKGE